MKKTLTYFKNIFTIAFFFVTFNSFSQENTAITVCCTAAEARCTGSSNCRACTNCSRCAYCNSGGSCGVCSKSSNKTQTYIPSKSNSNSSLRTVSSTVNDFYLKNETQSEYYLKTLIVTTDLLNLRNGPGANYSIRTKLKLNEKLIFLAKTGDWIKVRVKEDQLEGFVHSQYLTITEN